MWEVTKVNVESVCAFAKTMSDSVVFSGPLPNTTGDDMFSRMLSFNCWLSRWCPVHGVGFVDSCQTLGGNLVLLGETVFIPRGIEQLSYIFLVILLSL